MPYDNEIHVCEQFGPVYPALPALAKFRRIKNPTPEQMRAHGEAVREQFTRLAQAHLNKALEPERKAPCASGTWAADAASIRKHIRKQHAAKLQAGARADRARRTDAEIMASYEAAMAEKRAREARAA